MQKIDSWDFLSDYISRLCYGSEEDWMQQETVAKYAKELAAFYQDGHYNLYSSAYKYLRDASAENMEYLFFRLNKVVAYTIENNLCDPVNQEKMIKFKDYIYLESARTADSSRVIRLREDVIKEQQEITKLVDEVENSRKESSAQTITVLSIFTGIAMAFFGGFSLLGSAFNNLSYGLPTVAIVSTIIGFILFNTVFSFLYMAGKISGKPLAVCESNSCEKCPSLDECKGKRKEKKLPGILTRAWKRYPYIVLVDAILIGVLAIYSIAYAMSDQPKATKEINATETKLPWVSIESLYIGENAPEEQTSSENILKENVLPEEQGVSVSPAPTESSDPAS